jgi:hypothetical protein
MTPSATSGVVWRLPFLPAPVGMTKRRASCETVCRLMVDSCDPPPVGVIPPYRVQSRRPDWAWTFAGCVSRTRLRAGSGTTVRLRRSDHKPATANRDEQQDGYGHLEGRTEPRFAPCRRMALRLRSRGRRGGPVLAGSEPCGSRHRHSAASYDHFVRGSRLGVWGVNHLRPGRWQPASRTGKYKHPRTGVRGRFATTRVRAARVSGRVLGGYSLVPVVVGRLLVRCPQIRPEPDRLGRAGAALDDDPERDRRSNGWETGHDATSLHVMGPRPSGWGLGTARAVTIQKLQGLVVFLSYRTGRATRSCQMDAAMGLAPVSGGHAGLASTRPSERRTGGGEAPLRSTLRRRTGGRRAPVRDNCRG